MQSPSMGNMNQSGTPHYTSYQQNMNSYQTPHYSPTSTNMQGNMTPVQQITPMYTMGQSSQNPSYNQIQLSTPLMNLAS